jgi:hypothetical protein
MREIFLSKASEDAWVHVPYRNHKIKNTNNHHDTHLLSCSYRRREIVSPLLQVFTKAGTLRSLLYSPLSEDESRRWCIISPHTETVEA